MNADAWTQAAAYAGAAVCMGLGAIGSAWGEGVAAEQASRGIARQPANAAAVLRTMLVGQAVAESASIFALVVALLLVFTPWGAPGLLRAVSLFAAGLCMGAGALGPGVGAGLPAGTACHGVARTPRAGGGLNTLMLVGQAVAQTPAVFALLVSFLLLFKDFTGTPASLPAAAALLGAGVAAGFSGVGPGLGAGIAAAAACDGAARRPDRHALLLRTMLVGQAVSQSTAVYGLVVSLLLLYLY